MTVNWKINTLAREPETGVVQVAYWMVSAVSGGVTGSLYGAAVLPPPDPEEFIEYGDLNEAIALGWVHGVMGQDERDRLEAAATAAMDTALNPPVLNGVPW